MRKTIEVINGFVAAAVLGAIRRPNTQFFRDGVRIGPGKKSLHTYWVKVTQTRAYYDQSPPNTRQRIRAAQRANEKIERSKVRVAARRARVATKKKGRTT